MTAQEMLIKKLLWYLPGWSITLICFIIGMMVAINIITWESLCVFFSQPFNDWFGEIWNYLIGIVISVVGTLYDPRSEKVMLLTDEIKKEEVTNG